MLTDIRIGLDLMSDRSHGIIPSPEIVMIATPEAYTEDGTWDDPFEPTKDAPLAGT